jgi:hypothetical protein
MSTDQPSADDVQWAMEALETAHQSVTRLLQAFPKTREETALAAEIFQDIDRALAKLRFLFTTLEAAETEIKASLECTWGQCPKPPAST